MTHPNKGKRFPPDLGCEADLQKENDELREEVQACLQFLTTELHWEYFRADMLYHDDAEHERQSLQNAQAIKNFLVGRGWKCNVEGKVERLENKGGADV